MKLFRFSNISVSTSVAPLVGAWIEIFGCSVTVCGCTGVAPLVGAWIEMQKDKQIEEMRPKSLPSWERGLKFSSAWSVSTCTVVAPLVGAWIEIIKEFLAEPIVMSLPSWERGLK